MSVNASDPVVGVCQDGPVHAKAADSGYGYVIGAVGVAPMAAGEGVGEARTDLIACQR
jgi:hypothetical protein